MYIGGECVHLETSNKETFWGEALWHIAIQEKLPQKVKFRVSLRKASFENYTSQTVHGDVKLRSFFLQSPAPKLPFVNL